MKGKLSFNLDDPYENHEFKRAVNATRAYLCLDDVANKIFRPNRKHGYNEEIEKLISEGKTSEVIEILENQFYELINHYDIDLDSL